MRQESECLNREKHVEEAGRNEFLRASITDASNPHLPIFKLRLEIDHGRSDLIGRTRGHQGPCIATSFALEKPLHLLGQNKPVLIAWPTPNNFMKLSSVPSRKNSKFSSLSTSRVFRYCVTFVFNIPSTVSRPRDPTNLRDTSMMI